jgi:hypothetical protein
MPAWNGKIRIFVVFLLRFSSTVGKQFDITNPPKCENRPPPAVRVGGLIKLINEDNFERFNGSYPATDEGEVGGINYFVLDEAKSILYVTDFLNETSSAELKDFCVSGGRFTRSPIRGYGNMAGVSASNVRTRYVVHSFLARQDL